MFVILLEVRSCLDVNIYKYYVSVYVEEDIDIPQMKQTSIVGIDLKIKDLVNTSNFQKYKNEKIIEKYEKRLKIYMKELTV